MLTVHIAAVERKMRACQRCPPRCAPLPAQPFIKNPYTAPYRKLPFVPRSHLPTYVQKKLKKPVTQAQETRIRQSAQEAEARLWEAKGDVAMAETELRLRKLDLDARINAMAAGGDDPGDYDDYEDQVQDLRRAFDELEEDDQPASEKTRMREQMLSVFKDRFPDRDPGRHRRVHSHLRGVRWYWRRRSPAQKATRTKGRRWGRRCRR